MTFGLFNDLLISRALFTKFGLASYFIGNDHLIIDKQEVRKPISTLSLQIIKKIIKKIKMSVVFTGKL